MKSRAKDVREEMQEKERGKGGKGDGGCPFFSPPPLSLARPRASPLCSPLEKESLLAD